jgi:hypothetical protein
LWYQRLVSFHLFLHFLLLSHKLHLIIVNIRIKTKLNWLVLLLLLWHILNIEAVTWWICLAILLLGLAIVNMLFYLLRNHLSLSVILKCFNFLFSSFFMCFIWFWPYLFLLWIWCQSFVYKFLSFVNYCSSSDLRFISIIHLV